jgi:hypothetical protein
MSAINTNPTGLPRCHGLFGRVFGHKFQGRYNTTEKVTGQPSQEALETALEQCDGEFYVSGIIDSLYGGYKDANSEYIGDVCVRCGLTIKKEDYASNIADA